MLLVFAASASAQFHAGVTAGYSLTKNRLTMKGADAFAETGFGHGFYIGPTFEYNFGEHFAIEASLLFTRESGHFYVDPYKWCVSINDTYKSIMDHMWDVNNVPQEERDYDDMPYSDGELDDVRDMTQEGTLSTYSLRLPFVAKMKYGRLGLFAGLYADCHLFSQVTCNISVEDSGQILRFNEKSPLIKQQATYAYYILGNEKMPEEEIEHMPESKLKTLSQAYDHSIASRFNFGAIAGVEVYFTDNVGMNVSYYHDILTNFKKRFNTAGAFYGSGLNVGFNYRF